MELDKNYHQIIPTEFSAWLGRMLLRRGHEQVEPTVRMAQAGFAYDSEGTYVDTEQLQMDFEAQAERGW